MTRKAKEKRKVEDRISGTSIPDTSLSTLGYNPPTVAGQGALSTSQATGRSMQNSVSQANNLQGISQAQTTNGVASLLTRQPRFLKKKNIRKFLELGKAL
ncbi:RebB family R body protein [Pseudophaeobacter sp.]|uniref:RebB family R body protein n=1 Tax=Pseudophaeobacter sp. TaxID=1971739 RepID=UPI003296C542